MLNPCFRGRPVAVWRENSHNAGKTVLRLARLDQGCQQSITRDGLKDIFGKEISRDLIGPLHAHDLIGTGPRSPRRGAPYTFVTTQQFLVAFGMESLRDLPDREQMADAGAIRTF